MRRRGLPEAMVVAGAFAVRVVSGAALLTSHPSADAFEYTRLATNLREGHGFSMDATAPFHPSDIRMPGYPAVLAAFQSIAGGRAGTIVANATLGAVAVVGLLLIARRCMPHRHALVLGAVAAVYPPLATFSGYALSENLSIAALTWFVYGMAFAPARRRTVIVAVAGAVLVLTRSEGIAIAILGIGIACWNRPEWRRTVAVGVAVVAAVALAWAVRNDHEVHRVELSDAAYTDATLLAGVDGGHLHDQGYEEGFSIGRDLPVGDAGRARYASYVGDQVRDHLTLGDAVAKSGAIVQLPFGPLVRSSTTERTLATSVRRIASAHDTRDLARVLWDGVLLVQYVLAVIGLVLWWRRGWRRRVVAVAFYPVLVILLVVPLYAEQRLWLGAQWLLLVPAAYAVSVRLRPAPR